MAAHRQREGGGAIAEAENEQADRIAHLSFTRLADVAKQKAGLVAQQEVDDAHGKDLVSEAQVSAAKSSLTAAEEQVRVNAAELKRVETMLTLTGAQNFIEIHADEPSAVKSFGV